MFVDVANVKPACAIVIPPLIVYSSSHVEHQSFVFRVVALALLIPSPCRFQFGSGLIAVVALLFNPAFLLVGFRQILENNLVRLIVASRRGVLDTDVAYAALYLLRDSFSGTDDTALFESHGKRSKP